MAKVVTITNGTGSAELINGSYTVTSEVSGYDNSSINPSSVVIAEGTNEYSFTIAASGTLTLHVTEDGTTSGTPVVGATFIRTDSEGTEYGSQVTSDSEGNVVFSNVPFGSNAPIVYYKQTASDGEHEFVNTVQNTTLANETETIQIQNALGATRTINLTDANYANLPIDSGSLTLTN